MDGEFILKLKVYDPATIIDIFERAYGQKLQGAYDRSKFSQTGDLKVTDFYAGYYTNDSLFLVYTRESTILKVYVETTNGNDLRSMKGAINEYFVQVLRELKKNKVKCNEPLATITLEDVPFDGFVKTRKAKLGEIWEKQKEKLIIAPISGLISSFIAVYLNLPHSEDLTENLKKTVPLVLEAYVGVFVMIIVVLLLTRYKKQFTFSF